LPARGRANDFKEAAEKTIVLAADDVITDVITIGSSLDECSMVLKLAGASKVACITIAGTG
jgi:predicted amidophosphoribosyltransferase